MIRSIFLFLLFFSTAGHSISQQFSITGIVVDLTNNPVSGAEIIDHKGSFITITDSLGKFEFEGQVGIKYGVDKAGYDLTWFYTNKDVLIQKVVLKNRVQNIESVVISHKNTQEALDIQNVNIIDYRPLMGYILTLKKKKDTYYVGIDSLNTEGLSVPISVRKPRALFFDCMQNTYILTKDSAYQFVILDGEITFISKMSMFTFDTYISPCVADFDSSLVLSSLSFHNKRYDLTLFSNGTGKTFYTRMDTVGYHVAEEVALQLGYTSMSFLLGDSLDDSLLDRRRKMREIHNGANPDVNLAMLDNSVQKENYQSGEPLNAVERSILERTYYNTGFDSNGSTTVQLQASYMMRAQPVKIKSFQIGNYVATVNYDADTVSLFDSNGNPVQSVRFFVPCEVKDVWQDLANGFLYLYAKDGGSHKIYSLNALTGQVQYLKNFRGAPQTESGLIYDSWLYYRVIENGFYGIMRVKMPEPSFE